MISDEVRAIAERHAREDNELLARLLREGKVRRHAPPAGMRREAAALASVIEPLAKPRVNLAIRPNRKKGKRR